MTILPVFSSIIKQFKSLIENLSLGDGETSIIVRRGIRVVPVSRTIRVVEVIVAVRASGAPTVFREPQFSSAVLDLVAEEAGVEVADLHSTFGADIGTYAELMRTNARALLDGLTR